MILWLLRPNSNTKTPSLSTDEIVLYSGLSLEQVLELENEIN